MTNLHFDFWKNGPWSNETEFSKAKESSMLYICIDCVGALVRPHISQKETEFSKANKESSMLYICIDCVGNKTTQHK